MEGYGRFHKQTVDVLKPHSTEYDSIKLPHLFSF